MHISESHVIYKHRRPAHSSVYAHTHGAFTTHTAAEAEIRAARTAHTWFSFKTRMRVNAVLCALIIRTSAVASAGPTTTPQPQQQQHQAGNQRKKHDLYNACV